jgi:dihydrodipicolinate synthase/N-acetylneuraminate lyase
MPRYPQAVLVSCEIPWDERERLIEDVFRKEVRMVLEMGFNHLYVFGTAGEGYAVDTARFRQIVAILRDETGGDDIHPQVGVIGLSTANVVERVAIAHDAGFRTFQISLPSWGALNDAEVLTFFRDVCGAFPDSRFLHYNLPRAKRLLGGADYRRVADAVPNLVATKNTGGGAQRAADLMRHAPDLQHFFGEDNFMHGCMWGECSLLASFGAMVPRKTWEYFRAGLAGRGDEMLALHHGFLMLLRDVLGPALAQERIDGAYDKMIVRMGGLDDMPLRLLSPYQGCDEETYQEARRVFVERFADWMGSAPQ